MGFPEIVVPVVGALVFTAVLVGLILAVTRRIAARFVQEIEAEGIVRRTGRVTVRISLTQYRSARFGFASRAFSRKPGELVLVENALVLVAVPRVFRFAFADTEVWTDGGKLHLLTEKPVDASGTIDVCAKLPDAAEWRDLLVGRGAKLRT